jgi:hypothetical protein
VRGRSYRPAQNRSHCTGRCQSLGAGCALKEVIGDVKGAFRRSPGDGRPFLRVPPRTAGCAARREFGGLLGWVWPWSYGGTGLLGQITPVGGFPIVGFWLAILTAGLFLLAALAVAGIWVPFAWWRSLAIAAAVLSLSLMVLFLGPNKLLPIALDLTVLTAALAGWSPVGVR